MAIVYYNVYNNSPSATIICSKPTISDGTVTPTNATVNFGQSYEVTCNEGYNMTEGSDPTMTCGAGAAFDQTPTCEGSPAASGEL